jgi:hypothetical protein
MSTLESSAIFTRSVVVHFPTWGKAVWMTKQLQKSITKRKWPREYVIRGGQSVTNNRILTEASHVKTFRSILICALVKYGYTFLTPYSHFPVPNSLWLFHLAFSCLPSMSFQQPQFYDIESESSGTDSPWIPWFCSIKCHEFFCEVNLSFIRNPDNLVELQSSRGHLELALRDILDEMSDDDLADLSEEELDLITEEVYSQLHARYILTPEGLQAMVCFFSCLFCIGFLSSAADSLCRKTSFSGAILACAQE